MVVEADSVLESKEGFIEVEVDDALGIEGRVGVGAGMQFAGWDGCGSKHGVG